MLYEVITGRQPIGPLAELARHGGPAATQGTADRRVGGAARLHGRQSETRQQHGDDHERRADEDAGGEAEAPARDGHTHRLP